MRFFRNPFPAYNGAEENIAATYDIGEEIQRMVGEIIAKLPPSLDNCDGGLYVGAAGVGYMLYYLLQANVLPNGVQHYGPLALQYVNVSLQYARSSRDPECSLLLGNGGVYLLGAFVNHMLGDVAGSQQCVGLYENAGRDCVKVNMLRCGSDELFVGRAGWLYGVVELRRVFGASVIDDQLVRRVCEATIESGQAYAKRHNSRSPLMYAYYDTEYIGAAHGLSAILQVLLHYPQFSLVDRYRAVVQGAVDWILAQQQANGNWSPTAQESRSRGDDELLHWCHGAPGVVYLMAKAYEVFDDSKYLQACLRAGDLVWERGLLRKGPGICHGVAGNGYVHLLMYRLTQDRVHLYRAFKFAQFLHDPTFLREARTPDSPYSLYEGLAGTVCFLIDLLQPQHANFPLFSL